MRARDSDDGGAEPDLIESDTESPWGWVAVAEGRGGRALRDASLVLSSIGIPFELEEGSGRSRGARLLVSTGDGDRARHELAAYGLENQDWPPPRVEFAMRSDGVIGAGLYIAALALMYAISVEGTFGLDWWRAGRLEAGDVVAGHWERTLTALTLHVDLTHLLSNIVFGALFGVLTAHVLGGGLTWALALLAGILGNGANALVRDAAHRSVGASTSVFGILGLLTAYEWSRRSAGRQSTFRRLAPLFGGATLLGWLGVGEPGGRVDVLAHIFGLLAGGVLGVGASWTRAPERLAPSHQRLLGAATLAALVGGWWCALVRS